MASAWRRKLVVRVGAGAGELLVVAGAGRGTVETVEVADVQLASCAGNPHRVKGKDAVDVV